MILYDFYNGLMNGMEMSRAALKSIYVEVNNNKLPFSQNVLLESLLSLFQFVSILGIAMIVTKWMFSLSEVSKIQILLN